MRRLPSLWLVIFSFGCAQTPNLKLRVESARTARLAPELRRQLESNDAASVREIERELDLGRQRVANGRKAMAIVKVEPVIDGAGDVHAAKVARAECELKWDEAVLRSTEWRLASVASANELAKAETLSRAGDDIDVASYADQHERMRAGLAEALRQQAVLRSRFDDSEHLLSAAKARYAQSRADHLAAATSPTR